MWQQTWLFDYCTRWHTTQHAIRFGCHFLSHLQIITINLVLSPLPCLSLDRQHLKKKNKKKKFAHVVLLHYNISIHWNTDISRKSRWSDICNGRTKNWKIHKNVFCWGTKNRKIYYIAFDCPASFHTALWMRRWLKLIIRWGRINDSCILVH